MAGCIWDIRPLSVELKEMTQEVIMFDQQSAIRLDDKSPLHAIQIELQQGYALSPVEAQVLARRLQQIIDEQTGYTRGIGQVTCQAIAIDEPPGKSLDSYRNDYEQRRIRTAEGEMEVQVPQVRDALQTYRSQLMTFLRGNSEGLERLAVLAFPVA